MRANACAHRTNATNVYTSILLVDGLPWLCPPYSARDAAPQVGRASTCYLWALASFFESGAEAHTVVVWQCGGSYECAGRVTAYARPKSCDQRYIVWIGT